MVTLQKNMLRATIIIICRFVEKQTSPFTHNVIVILRFKVIVIDMGRNTTFVGVMQFGMRARSHHSKNDMQVQVFSHHLLYMVCALYKFACRMLFEICADIGIIIHSVITEQGYIHTLWCYLIRDEINISSKKMIKVHGKRIPVLPKTDC